MRYALQSTAALIVLFSWTSTTEAHPGRTAGDGCHYCRTNCDSWGEAWNERHCHGGGGGGGAAPAAAAPVRTTTVTQPRCPANSSYNSFSKECECYSGYAAFASSCVKIPANAHAIVSTTDAWECDAGYEESNGACVQKEVQPSRANPDSLQQFKTGNPPVAQQAADAAIPETNEASSGGGFIAMAAIGGGYWYWRRRRKKKQSNVS